MSYISQSDLLSFLQTDMLANGMNDTNAGAVDATIFAGILAAAEDEIHSYLEARFATPLSPAPALVKHAARLFCAEAVFARRGITKDQNPFANRADNVRKQLEQIQRGELRLMLASEDLADSKGSAITEPSKIIDTGSQLADMDLSRSLLGPTESQGDRIPM